MLAASASPNASAASDATPQRLTAGGRGATSAPAAAVAIAAPTRYSTEAAISQRLVASSATDDAMIQPAVCHADGTREGALSTAAI